MAKEKNIGINVTPPKESCDDQNCPFHGKISVRGRQFLGNVTKTGSQKTATVEWDRLVKVKKYERYEKRRTKLQVHNPPCINAQPGDIVRIMETRPLSKTKNYVIIEIQKKQDLKQLISQEEKKERDQDKDKSSKTKTERNIEKTTKNEIPEDSGDNKS
ncbi:30S ribosomal protein S17 [Nanoarchaeota archaeon]